MRDHGRAVLLLTFVFSACALVAQTDKPASQAKAAASSLLARAQSAVSGGALIQDAALTGKVRRIAGSEDERGTVVLKATASGEMRLDMNFPSGTRNVIRTRTQKVLAGSWSGPDGKEHAASFQALKTDDAEWFFPGLMLGRLAQLPGVSLTESAETRRGSAVEHVHIVQAADSRLPAYAVKIVEHADQMELYLDTATLLPVAATFNTHPEHDLGRDIPVEMRFLNYRNVNGAQVPFRVQEYLNRMLVLDLEFETAELNTGVPTSAR